MKRGAALGHVLLYALALMALPLSGWYWSSVADKPILVASLFILQPLVAPNPDLYDLAKLVRTWTAWFCGALVRVPVVCSAHPGKPANSTNCGILL